MSEQVREPDVVQAVTEEIKKLGDNTKANYDELNRRYEELKGLVDSQPKEIRSDVKEQITKLTEDITTRQAALDENITKRVDNVEVAVRRLPRQILTDTVNEEKDAKEFFTAQKAIKDDKGANYRYIDGMDVDVDLYRQYKKSFLQFMRINGDERAMSPEDQKSLSVGKDPDGGYLVTPAMSNRIIQRVFESDPIRQLASVETITTGAIEWNVDWGEAGSGWEGEYVAGDETDTPQWNKKRIPVHILYAAPRATQTLLEDAGINVETWLANHVARRFARQEGVAFVSGDGVDRPRGFTTYSSGTTFGTVEQVAMGAAAALTADGFIGVKYSLKEEFLNRGTWLMNRLTVADAMYLKDGTGNYIWKPGLADDNVSTILGLPVRMSTTMATVAANALSVALADWAEAYMIVDRLGITVLRDPYSVRPFVEFYTRKRVGADVINYDALKIGIIST